jgi:hypothetical protein
MQVGNPGGAVDVMRSTSRRRDATIKRLANLTDDYKIINISHTQGAENIFPGRRKRSIRERIKRSTCGQVALCSISYLPATSALVARTKDEVVLDSTLVTQSGLTELMRVRATPVCYDFLKLAGYFATAGRLAGPNWEQSPLQCCLNDLCLKEMCANP